MKAAILSAFGEPLSIQDRPSPVPGAGEVVVSVVAAPVLSYAAQVFDGSRQYHLDLPVVPGCGAIGQIAQVGADATRLKAGEWVFCGPVVRSRDDPVMPDTLLQGWIASGEGAERLHAHFHDGPFAEQVLVPMESVTPIGEIDPSDVPQWCALNTLLVPYGGWLAAGLQPGETVLVNSSIDLKTKNRSGMAGVECGCVPILHLPRNDFVVHSNRRAAFSGSRCRFSAPRSMKVLPDTTLSRTRARM
jgi:alcohol dehydrogenase